MKCLDLVLLQAFAFRNPSEGLLNVTRFQVACNPFGRGPYLCCRRERFFEGRSGKFEFLARRIAVKAEARPLAGLFLSRPVQPGPLPHHALVHQLDYCRRPAAFPAQEITAFECLDDGLDSRWLQVSDRGQLGHRHAPPHRHLPNAGVRQPLKDLSYAVSFVVELTQNGFRVILQCVFPASNPLVQHQVQGAASPFLPQPLQKVLKYGELVRDLLRNRSAGAAPARVKA